MRFFYVMSVAVSIAFGSDPSSAQTVASFSFSGTDEKQMLVISQLTQRDATKLLPVADKAIPWVFTSSTVVIACARPSLTVMKVGSKYAALNGSTSTSARTKSYVIKEASGHRVPFIGTQNDDDLINEGLVKPESEYRDMNAWISAFNNELRKKCM